MGTGTQRLKANVPARSQIWERRYFRESKQVLGIFFGVRSRRSRNLGMRIFRSTVPDGGNGQKPLGIFDQKTSLERSGNGIDRPAGFDSGAIFAFDQVTHGPPLQPYKLDNALDIWISSGYGG